MLWVNNDESPRIIRITDEQGGDPLVRQYALNHAADSAMHILSWWYLVLALPTIVAAGAVGNMVGASPPPPPAWVMDGSLAWYFHQFLGNRNAVLLGMLVGTVMLSSIASIAGMLARGRRPAMTQEPWYACIVVLLGYLLLYDPLVAASVITSAIALAYGLVMGFRLLALGLGGRPGAGLVEQRADDEWPIYTVLVPLYREEAVATKILANLKALDYPHHRLDVKFLLEADDPGTLAAIERDGIPQWCEVIIVPDAQPKTKPRACNHGLQRARGEYLVIFDAEDRPEPDQLKKAVSAFAQHPPQVVCLQAQLAYHNHKQNLLTRWFTIEYNVWFQRYLSGLHRLGGPLPLGGTSNHFKMEALRRLDGWDPFNVTEDCDLGIRLHVAGQRTATLDSVTWEEANSRVGNWLRQRSRWLKGYLVTHIVWCRRPLYLAWQLGPLGTFRFFCSILGIAGLAILNLALWTILSVYAVVMCRDLLAGWSMGEILALPPEIGDGRWSWPLLYLRGDSDAGVWIGLAHWFGVGDQLPAQDPLWSVLSVLFAGVTLVLLLSNFVFVIINMIFGHRAGQRGLIVAALFTPLYWVLISLAGWKGLWQLCFNPHKWEKTVHGLDQDKS